MQIARLLRMNRTLSLALVLLASCLLSACNSKITPENLSRVSLGMGTKEVESILGKPHSVETTELPLLSTCKYSYVEGSNTITLVFINDKLIDKQGSISNINSTPSDTGIE